MGVGTVVVALSSVFAVTNCASEDSLQGTDFGSDADAGVSLGGDASIHLGSQGGASAAPTERLSALCGRGSCVPDDGAACEPSNSLGGYGGNLGAGDESGPSEGDLPSPPRLRQRHLHAVADLWGGRAPVSGAILV
jgi:hypothetical protein